MIVVFSAVLTEESLENVAKASSIVIFAIRTPEVDPIKELAVGMSIESLLKLFWKKVRSN